MTSPPIGTDQELIERLGIMRSALYRDGRTNAAVYMHEAADALQSRISEVERLTARVTKLEETLRQVASRSHAALSQQGKV